MELEGRPPLIVALSMLRCNIGVYLHPAVEPFWLSAPASVWHIFFRLSSPISQNAKKSCPNRRKRPSEARISYFIPRKTLLVKFRQNKKPSSKFSSMFVLQYYVVLKNLSAFAFLPSLNPSKFVFDHLNERTLVQQTCPFENSTRGCNCNRFVTYVKIHLAKGEKHWFRWKLKKKKKGNRKPSP